MGTAGKKFCADLFSYSEIIMLLYYWKENHKYCKALKVRGHLISQFWVVLNLADNKFCDFSTKSYRYIVNKNKCRLLISPFSWPREISKINVQRKLRALQYVAYPSHYKNITNTTKCKEAMRWSWMGDNMQI